jgi:hypothetical protein
LVSSAPTPDEEQFGPVQQFKFSVTPVVVSNTKPHAHVWDKPGELDITLEYGARACQGPTIFFTWADTTHNLRRVDFRPWAVRLRIHHFVPLPKAKESRATKLSEFAELVRKNEAGFLESWLETACSGVPNGPVHYRLVPDGAPVWEQLSFNLVELGDPAAEEHLMGPSLNVFGEILDLASAGGPLYDDDDPKQRAPV